MITANFYNLTSWKNGRNGAIAGKVADVRFINFKTADNILAGIEYERVLNEMADGLARVENATIVGRSNNSDWRMNLASPHGIIAPRSENFTIMGAKFYNLDFNNAAALGDCSHCFHDSATDSGGRTVTVKDLYFDPATTLRKIKYQYPFQGIFRDLTGELTGKGPNTYAVANGNHNKVKECETNRTIWDGQACDNTVQARRLSFYGANKQTEFEGMYMLVLPYDDEILNSYSNFTTDYVSNRSNYGIVDYKEKSDPMLAWTGPIITGHKYKVHWSWSGIDWMGMKMQHSMKWMPDDNAVHLVHNYSDARALIEVKKGATVMENDTIPLSTSLKDGGSFETGMNVLYNHTGKKEFNIVLSGKNNTPAN